jgi:hypothetical protein
MDDVKRKRNVDDPKRDQLMTPDGDAVDGGGASEVLKTLQQTAGNTAVGSLLRTVGPAPGVGRPAAKTPGGTAGSAGAGTGFEEQLFEQSILGPLRAAYACVRDSPPDHALAMQHLQRVGEALWDYEQRYRGTDEGLANGFYAARGWLGRVARELGMRLGTGKPMSDQTIAMFVSDTLADLNGLQGRLH